MSAMTRFLIPAAGAFALAFLPGTAAACTVAGSTVNVGSFSSYTVGTTTQQGSGSAGLQCDVVLAALATHYVGLRVDNSTFLLTGPAGPTGQPAQTISYIASLAPNGAALVSGGAMLNLSSTSVVSLFGGANSTVPIYIRTTPKTALRAGTYTGFIDLRWYFSVCTVGVLVCVTETASPGFVRPGLLTPVVWGTGVGVRINVQLTIQNDCIITAPEAGFGSAALIANFNPITRTIAIRCSADTAYTVGLSDGSNADNGVRRMQAGTTGNYLRYEIYKSAASTERWGSATTARRSSATADTNAGTYDSVTTQGFTYRAAMLPGQVTPPAGVYRDTVVVDVSF